DDNIDQDCDRADDDSSAVDVPLCKEAGADGNLTAFGDGGGGGCGCDVGASSRGSVASMILAMLALGTFLVLRKRLEASRS
ncbi:hypothetical protein K1X76_09770, partial [bacterium]|nr:hypothetical protein [bacterium]